MPLFYTAAANLPRNRKGFAFYRKIRQKHNFQKINSPLHTPLVQKTKFGCLLETNTQRGNTYHFYDPWGRVFYTERTEGTNETRKSVSWIGRNAFGDVTETDIWTADGNSYAASFTVYDVLGHAVASTNELGNVTENTYDTQGRIVSVSGATYPVRYAHDTAGRMTGLSTTRDETAWDETTWTYHPQTGLPAAKTYADGSKRG